VAPTPDEASRGGLGRELGLPLLTLLGSLGLSAGRMAQGVPLDGVSLALHLVGGLAALRLVPPVVRLAQQCDAAQASSEGRCGPDA
jgi:hypothetical protein